MPTSHCSWPCYLDCLIKSLFLGHCAWIFCTTIVITENIFSFGSFFTFKSDLLLGSDAVYNKTAYIFMAFLWFAIKQFMYWFYTLFSSVHVWGHFHYMRNIVVVLLPFLIDVQEQSWLEMIVLIATSNCFCSVCHIHAFYIYLIIGFRWREWGQ